MSKEAPLWRQLVVEFWPQFSANFCTKTAFKCAILVALVALMEGLLALRTAAQGCAMCYQNASASGDAGRAALRHGILILLLPALSLFLGVFALIYRRRDPAR